MLRPALKAFIEAGLNKTEGGRLLSYRELAREIPGTSYSAVRRWIEQDFPRLFRVMGGGESQAPGGLPDSPQPPTPEESVIGAARWHIAESAALVRGLPGSVRWRVAEEVEALLRELTWDRPEGAEGKGEDDTF